MDNRETLFRLCNLPGPAGFENNVAKAAVELMAPLVEEAYVDSFGNAVGLRRCGKANAKKLLLDAHLDEIGLMVTGIEDGYLRFRAVGGVDPRVLPNREVTVLTNPPLPGIVACLPPHVQTAETQNQSVPISELYIDVGMCEETARRLIPVGTPAVFRSHCFGLGERQVCGKALDDRACFTALLRTLELLKDVQLDVDLIVQGSTREEVGGAGAKVSTYAHAPDCCIAVDVTHGKTPDSSVSKDGVFELGGGPAIGVGPNMTRWMVERMKQQAEQRKIPYQLEIISGHSGTNGWHMQIVREGIATALLSLPIKYMHSPNETLDLSDLENTAQLLAAFITNLGQEGAFGLCWKG